MNRLYPSIPQMAGRGQEAADMHVHGGDIMPLPNA